MFGLLFKKERKTSTGKHTRPPVSIAMVLCRETKETKNRTTVLNSKKYLKTVFLEVIGGNSVLFAQSKE